MKLHLLALLSVFLALPIFAQAAPKGVNLAWSDPTNPTGTTYTVYRSPGLCSGTPTWAALASGLTVKTYRDLPGVGQFCYKVDAVLSGIESSGSNTTNPIVPPVDVTLSAVVQ